MCVAEEYEHVIGPQSGMARAGIHDRVIALVVRSPQGTSSISIKSPLSSPHPVQT